jgi:hypothetical protein
MELLTILGVLAAIGSFSLAAVPVVKKIRTERVRRRVEALGLNLAELSEDEQRLCERKPPLWRWALFSKRLLRRLESNRAVNPRLTNAGTTKLLSWEESRAFVQARVSEVLQFNDELDAATFSDVEGAEEEQGARDLLRLAERLADLHKEYLAWTRAVAAHAFPTNLERVQQALRQYGIASAEAIESAAESMWRQTESAAITQTGLRAEKHLKVVIIWPEFPGHIGADFRMTDPH